MRKEKGWSQEAFADKCGIQRAHMSLNRARQAKLDLCHA
ncbi:MAG TPA: helix-turn-helix transcriptional regulator [Candidatus Angelobacter sp.]|nr:helix-turn-helix transcriptional regulator [Candidatus Angelobacter sp.]